MTISPIYFETELIIVYVEMACVVTGVKRTYSIHSVYKSVRQTNYLHIFYREILHVISTARYRNEQLHECLSKHGERSTADIQ